MPDAEPSKLTDNDPHVERELVASVHTRLQQALHGGTTADIAALADLGFTSPAVALTVKQLLMVAGHHDADDVPGINISDHYRIVAGLLAKNANTAAEEGA